MNERNGLRLSPGTLVVLFGAAASGPADYNRLVAEIYFDGRFVALVSQERGAGVFDIETPGTGLDENEIERRVDLAKFVEVTEEVCRRLVESF